MTDRYPERRAGLTPERALQASVVLLDVVAGAHPRATGRPARLLAARKLEELRAEMEELRRGVRTRFDEEDNGWVEVRHG